jgi:hypothetical protein
MASVAVEQLAQEHHGKLLPVPCLAFGPLSMSRHRRLRISGRAFNLVDAEVFFTFAPINVAHVTINVSAIHISRVAQIFVDFPCHRFLTTLEMGVECSPQEQHAKSFLERLPPLQHVSSIVVRGRGSLLAATHFQPTLRRLSVNALRDAPMLDLSAFSALQRVDSVGGCPQLTSIKLPPTVTRIGHNCLFRCPAITHVDISNTQITRIGKNFLFYCVSAVSVILPATLRAVGAYCFGECGSLVDIDLSANQRLVSIGSDFAGGCHELRTIRLPTSLNTLGSRAFRSCAKLAAMDVSHTRLESVGAGFMAAADPEQVAWHGWPATLSNVDTKWV